MDSNDLNLDKQIKTALQANKNQAPENKNANWHALQKQIEETISSPWNSIFKATPTLAYYFLFIGMVVHYAPTSVERQENSIDNYVLEVYAEAMESPELLDYDDVWIID